MLCSIYDTQREILEQDREIMEYIGIGESVYITEGFKDVIHKIGEGILFVLRKIKELIIKAFNWITGKKKQEDQLSKEAANTSSQELKKMNEEITQSSKTIKNSTDEIKKEAQKAKSSGKEMEDNKNNGFILINYTTPQSPSHTSNKPQVQETPKKPEVVLALVDKIQEEIDKINNEKKYIKIYAPDTVVKDKTVTSFKDNETVKMLFGSIDDCFSILSDPNKYNKFSNGREDGYKIAANLGYKNLAELLESRNYDIRMSDEDDKRYDKYNSAFRIGRDAGNSSTMFTSVDDREDSEKLTREEYFKQCWEYSQIAEKLKGRSFDGIKDMEETLNSKIKPIENKTLQLEKQYNSKIQSGEMEENKGYTFIYKNLYKTVNILLELYINQIRRIRAVERLYNAYLYNAKMIVKDKKRLDKLSKKR